MCCFKSKNEDDIICIASRVKIKMSEATVVHVVVVISCYGNYAMIPLNAQCLMFYV